MQRARQLSRLMVGRRTFAAASDTATKAIAEYLERHGITNNKQINGITNAFGGKLSMSDLKMLGPAGIKALVATVDREIADEEKLGNKDPIEIRIDIPHERHSMVLQAIEGDNFYDLVQKYPDLQAYLECPCGGMAACSTCHIIVDAEYFDKIPDAEESEFDMLDLAAGTCETSRLGCKTLYTPYTIHIWCFDLHSSSNLLLLPLLPFFSYT